MVELVKIVIIANLCRMWEGPFELTPSRAGFPVPIVKAWKPFPHTS
jgi:hypothetical protein